jgi:hypothetical protein
VGEQPNEAGKAENEALVQAPALTGSMSEGRESTSSTPHDLDVVI